MASMTEQFLAHLSWKSWSQAKDLHKRILFTLGVLIVYRLGCYIPIPGVNPEAMKMLAKEYSGQGILSMFNMISGNSLERMAIFALNLMPYISASIIVQLLTAIVPYFMALKKEGESGKRKLSQYTRYGTVAIASMQGIGLASALMLRPGIVYQPGIFFSFSLVVTVLGATLFLMWLGEQITARGVGNGSSMIIYAGILSSLPRSILEALEMSRTGGVASSDVLLAALAVVAVVFFVVFMERSYRKIPVNYPKRQVGHQIVGGQQTYMPLKLNITGVLPPIFASAILGFLDMFSRMPFWTHVPVISSLMGSAGSGKGYTLLTVQVFLIVFFAFFYTTIVFNPEETAENLRKSGAFIPGYRPGAMTANYFVYLLNRLTVIGSFYIALVVVLPSLANIMFGLNFPFQGTSFLISVSVSLELISQVHSYIISHQYGHLMRKGTKQNTLEH